MSDIVTNENTFYDPICNRCKNKLTGLKCKAFDVIPDSILTGKENHNKPLPEQENNIVFEPIK